MMSPRRNRWMAALVIAFGVFHAASLLLALLPRGWAVNRALEPYRKVTGTPQHWRMFHTIPRVRDRQITVTVRDAEKVFTLGPILPAMEEFEPDRRIRYYQLLDRLTSPDNPYLGDYVKSLAREMAKSPELDGLKFELNIETDYIRLLKRIEEDGKMTLHRSESLGPFVISEGDG